MLGMQRGVQGCFRGLDVLTCASFKAIVTVEFTSLIRIALLEQDAKEADMARFGGMTNCFTILQLSINHFLEIDRPFSS